LSEALDLRAHLVLATVGEVSVRAYPLALQTKILLLTVLQRAVAR
jgi:hypothetical protein